MSQMAEATGGRAFYNTNGLTQAVATAITTVRTSTPSPTPPPIPSRDGSSARSRSSWQHQGQPRLPPRLLRRRPGQGPSHHKGQPPIQVADSAVTRSPTSSNHARRHDARLTHTHRDHHEGAVFPVASHPDEDTRRPNGSILSESARPLPPLQRQLRHRALRHHISPRPRRQNPRRLRARHLRLQPGGVLLNRLDTDHANPTASAPTNSRTPRHPIHQQISAPPKASSFSASASTTLPATASEPWR